MNIGHIEEHSFIYGPGCRFVIWVQGCSIKCHGCWNSDMWSFDTKNDLSVNELFARILIEQEFIEGITLLGGEPLDQYIEVLELIQKCNKIGLSTMLFTGYEIEEIKHNNKIEIFSFLDIIISGRYNFKKRTLNHQWIGSTNQKITFSSKRYNINCLENANYIEISIDKTGKSTLLGFPNEEICANYCI